VFRVLQFNLYFGIYGKITDSVIMKDRKTGQPRGFGFITYANPSVVDKVVEDSHIINAKQVQHVLYMMSLHRILCVSFLF
jgi:RNA recognition motif-containing protein